MVGSWNVPKAIADGLEDRSAQGPRKLKGVRTLMAGRVLPVPLHSSGFIFSLCSTIASLWSGTASVINSNVGVDLVADSD